MCLRTLAGVSSGCCHGTRVECYQQKTLPQVNSETDFVAINSIFKEFASDVAMQIAANPDVGALSVLRRGEML